MKLDKSLADAKQMTITCYLYNIRPYVDPDTSGASDCEEVSEEERRNFEWKDHALQLFHLWQDRKPITMTVSSDR